ncbi:hypothetical protein KAW65_06855 [candidate division WOR-3 bacterium]|nr:hypothetical protein [candidate division WOR-3 bacterium]
MRKKNKSIKKKVRFPLPPKAGHPHTTKKGKKVYRRKSKKEETKKLIEEEL